MAIKTYIDLAVSKLCPLPNEGITVTASLYTIRVLLN
jgi:hypothetical protein